VGIRVPSRCTRSRPAGRGPASGERACAGGAVLPRASAARTAVEQRGPGHRAPCGVISRQAKHTRIPWVSSHASGGAAPVDRCTERKWDTKDCRQLHHVGEAPSRRAHRGMGQSHIPEGWVEAMVRGRGRGVLGWDGSLACPSYEGSSISMGPVTAGEPPVHQPACRRATVLGRYPSGPLVGPAGHPLYLPARPRVPVPDRSPPVPPWGGTLRWRGRSRLCWGIRT